MDKIIILGSFAMSIYALVTYINKDTDNATWLLTVAVFMLVSVIARRESK